MPLGHSFTPLVRITPPAGAQYTVSLGALAVMTVCQPTYEPLHFVKEMLTRAVRKVKYGFRVHVHQEFKFSTPSADETTLAQQVVTPLTDPDNEYLAELSLDNGATYRQAELVDYQQGPIDDKNIGVRIALDWTCTEPIASKPALGSGAW